MEQKQYVGYVKRQDFQNGGHILKVSLRYADLKPNERGYVNLIVAEKKEKDERGNTHNIYVDTFVPKKKEEQQTPKPEDALNEGDLPF